MTRAWTRVLRLIRFGWPVLVMTALLCLLSGLAPFGGLAVRNRAVEMLIDVVLVVGFYSFAGLSGVLSFGHMSFMSIGAYVGALLTIPPALKGVLLPHLPSTIAHAQLSLIPAVLIAGAAAATFAVVISIPLMRLPNLAISLGMFAVLVIVYQVESNWNSVTRGRAAMVGVPTNTGLVVALVGAICAIVLAFAFQESAHGLRLRASRDDELAAASIGVNVVNERRGALILSGFLIGGGGLLFAQYLGVFTPNSFYLDITFLTIAMLVIGGTRSLTGAVLGPVFVSVLNYGLQQIENGFSVGPVHIPGRSGLQQVGLALVMLLVLIFRPSGLAGGKEVPFPGRRLLRPRLRRANPLNAESTLPSGERPDDRPRPTAMSSEQVVHPSDQGALR